MRLLARLVEYGLFRPPSEVQDEVRDAYEFLHVPAIGVDRPMQFFRVAVGGLHGIDGREFVVVDSKTEVDREALRKATAGRFGRAGCVFLVRDGEGHATVDHELDTEACEIAAAVAAIRYAAAWDESEVIVVTGPGSRHDVAITFEDKQLWAVVRTAAG